MIRDYANDPILQLAKEANEQHQSLSKALEEAKKARAIAQGIYELGQTHSFRQLIEKLEESEKRAINRMIASETGTDFNFDRGWVHGLRVALAIIRDTESSIKELDRRIAVLKNQVADQVQRTHL